MSKLTASKLLSRCRRALARQLAPLPPRDKQVQAHINAHRGLAWLDRKLNPGLYRSPETNEARQRDRLPTPPPGRSRR